MILLMNTKTGEGVFVAVDAYECLFPNRMSCDCNRAEAFNLPSLSPYCRSEQFIVVGWDDNNYDIDDVNPEYSKSLVKEHTEAWRSRS